jgi:hypothetical protein
VVEKFPDRRDSLKIQAGVEWMRQIAEGVGDRWKTTEGAGGSGSAGGAKTAPIFQAH